MGSNTERNTELAEAITLGLDAAPAANEQLVDELQDCEDTNAAALQQFDAALSSRDVIGQAKGIVMETLHCSADEAFDYLVGQSQRENRKLVEIAAAVADGTHRPSR